MSARDLVMVDVHAIALYAALSFSQALHPLQGLILAAVRAIFSMITSGSVIIPPSNPVPQRLGIAMPAGTSGKGETLIGITVIFVTRHKKGMESERG